MQAHSFHCYHNIVLCSEYTISLLACWMTYFASLTHQQTQNIVIHLPFSKWQSGQRRANVFFAIEDKIHVVIEEGCHHYASGALHCCTDRRNRMNILTQTNRVGGETCQELNCRRTPI